MKTNPTILIVDDEVHIRDLLQFLLTDEGYNVLCSENGEQAITMAYHTRTDLVILDINLPGMDGYAVCKELSGRQIPVLFLSSRDEEHDVIYGLEVGALDYIRKPFNHRELILRIKNLLGRRPAPRQEGRGFVCGDVQLEIAEQQVSQGGQAIRLSPTEFDLLKLLMSHHGAVVTLKEILGEVWGNEDWDGGRELVKVNIRRLRKKIEPDPHNPQYIINQWGRGYSFRGTVTEL